MKKTKIFMISCWMVFLSGNLFMAFLSQGRSQYFTGNQFLITSIIIYIPLFIIVIMALAKVSAAKEY
jgi:hypothetical protein